MNNTKTWEASQPKQDLWNVTDFPFKMRICEKFVGRKKMTSSHTHRLSTRDADESTKTWEPSQQKQDLRNVTDCSFMGKFFQKLVRRKKKLQVYSQMSEPLDKDNTKMTMNPRWHTDSVSGMWQGRFTACIYHVSSPFQVPGTAM